MITQSELFFTAHPDPEVRRIGLRLCELAAGLRDVVQELGPRNPREYQLAGAGAAAAAEQQAPDPAEHSPEEFLSTCLDCGWSVTRVARRLGYDGIASVYHRAQVLGIDWVRSKQSFYAGGGPQRRARAS